MRHRKGVNHLGRTSAHRKAMLANMASSLIKHKRIKTTLQKAKELRMFVEPLITKSKEDSTHSRRIVFSSLQDKNAVTELFREVAPKIAERHGGYTRILKLDNRVGDSAEMCFIELVDFNVNLISGKEAAPKAKAKRRRGSKKGAGQPAASVTPEKSLVKEEESTEVTIADPDLKDEADKMLEKSNDGSGKKKHKESKK